MSEIVPRLSVIIPMHNEASGVSSVLAKLIPLAREHAWEVIVVDDCSTDGSWDLVQECVGLNAIRHTRNRGYGAALKTGIRRACGEWVAMMDADGQHDPRELLKLLPYTMDHDLVIGKRDQRGHTPFWRVPGKWLITRISSFLVRQNIPDLNSGMRIFRRETIMRYLHLFPDGFSFTTTCTLIFFNRGYSVKFSPIVVQSRQGKSLVTFGTGFDVLILIFRIATLFDPIRVFMPVCGVLLVSGLLWGVPYVLQGQGVSTGALLLVLVGILIFFFGLLVDQVTSLRKERFE